MKIYCFRVQRYEKVLKYANKIWQKNRRHDNGHICDDCRHCEWHTQEWNLDPFGQPITFGCQAGVFEHGEVRGKRACELWDKKYDDRGVT